MQIINIGSNHTPKKRGSQDIYIENKMVKMKISEEEFCKYKHEKVYCIGNCIYIHFDHLILKI